MRVTASKVGLLEHCAWSFRPEAEWSNTTSAAADRGTRFHRAIADYIGTGETPAMADDIAQLFASARVWVDQFGREKLQAEVAFAWCPNTDTAEHIAGAEREYATAHGRLCGTADGVAISKHTRVGFVLDWATGDGSRKGPQLRCLGLMVARTFDLDMVTVQSLEVDETGVRVVVDETLDTFALAAVAGGLAEVISSIGDSQPTPGVHCGELYCNARATCPTVRERLADIIPAAALTQHRWGLTIGSADHAMWLYNQAKAVEAAAKLVKDAVKAYVPEEGLTLSDGSVFAEGSREMPRFDKARALALLREKGATEQEIDACTYTAIESSGLRVKKPAKSRRKAA